jgi:hypothetical protein
MPLTTLLSAKQAAERFGISVPTMYDWLSRSDYGFLIIRGQKVTIRYFQGGCKGEGRIRIETAEVERIIELMRVMPQQIVVRRPSVRRHQFPGITVPLGRPTGAP